jgi:hypothetical protein
MGLIGRYAMFDRSEYLIKYLIIVPSTASVPARLEIVNEWLSNGFDNSEALFNLDLQNETDFDVIVVVEREGVHTSFDLREYPKENS